MFDPPTSEYKYPLPLVCKNVCFPPIVQVLFVDPPPFFLEMFVTQETDTDCLTIVVLYTNIFTDSDASYRYWYQSSGLYR